MGKNAPDVEEVPDYQTGTYKMGGAASTTTKNGNNITASYTAAPGEQKSYDYIQGIMSDLVQNATHSGDFEKESKIYADNQKRQLNDDFTKSLTMLKAGLGTSGQMKDSVALDRLRPLETSYLNAVQNVNANAPKYAQELRANDQAYNTNALNNGRNELNSYYQLGQNMHSGSLGLSNQGNQWAQQNYENRRQHAMDQFAAEQADRNATKGYIAAGSKLAGQLAMAYFSGGASLGAPGGMPDLSGI